MVQVSIILLTFNRKKIVDSCVRQGLQNADYPIKEIIWVDNGSIDGVDLSDIANINVKHKENTGVAKGYNTGFRLAQGDYIVMPGTDQKLPNGWLKLMVESLKDDAMKIKAKNGSVLYRRECFEEFGYFREDFGLYGREEEEYGHRIGGNIQILEITGAEHLGTEGAKEYDGKDDKKYWEMKNKETNDPEKIKRLKEIIKKGDYYNPYN